MNTKMEPEAASTSLTKRVNKCPIEMQVNTAVINKFNDSEDALTCTARFSWRGRTRRLACCDAEGALLRRHGQQVQPPASVCQMMLTVILTMLHDNHTHAVAVFAQQRGIVRGCATKERAAARSTAEPAAETLPPHTQKMTGGESAYEMRGITRSEYNHNCSAP